VVDLVPGYQLDGDDIWFEPASGYADPRMMVLSVLFAFLASRGRVRRATVRSIRRLRRTWLLGTSGGDVEAPTVLLAAGAGTASLLPQPDAVPSVTRAPAWVGLFRLPPGAMTTVVIDLSCGLLLRPHPRGVLGSVRECGAGGFLPTLRRLAATRIPFLLASEPEVVARSEFDITPDGKPLIGPVDEGLYVAYGFGGSGFKLAPALCRAISNLVGTGAVPRSLAAYDPLRACGAGAASPLLG
jgi:glycine/D-amino acid oxidase-like deaminating enzyme